MKKNFLSSGVGLGLLVSLGVFLLTLDPTPIWSKESKDGNTPSADQTISPSASPSSGAGPPPSTSPPDLNPASSLPAQGAGEEGKFIQSGEPELSSSPFSEFGEYNGLSDDEEFDTFYFQNGRFFGLSFGLGLQVVDQNRGSLWDGGFPTVDLRIHYWFDFNFALNIYVFSAYNFYNTNVNNLGHVDVNLVSAGLYFKYYIDTRNLSSSVTFASPYALLGVGSFYKVETSNAAATQDSENSIGLSGGVGLEFPIVSRKTYFQLEARINSVTFGDTYTTVYEPNLPNLVGFFYTVTGSILLTW